MIENIDQLLDVMARAAFDERRKDREGAFLTWDMLGIMGQGNVKLEIRAALLAAQAEGAEMVPSEAVVPLFGRAYLPANPLRLPGDG